MTAQALEPLGQAAPADIAFGEGLARAVEASAVLPAQVERRQHHDGNVCAFGHGPHGFQELEQYLKRMGPDVALTTFAEFAAATADENAVAPGGVLSFVPTLAQFGPCLADPSRPPDISDFVGLKTAYLDVIETVFSEKQLDALVFRQMREGLAGRESGDAIHATTVGEINIAGLPGVTVPAGYYASGAPFCLIFVGLQWTEADLLALAFAYETATRHRRAPVFTVE